MVSNQRRFWPASARTTCALFCLQRTATIRAGKGDGRITDDTLMTEALIRADVAAGRHLDAYGYEKFLLPEIGHRKVWFPERRQDLPILELMSWAERFPWARLKTAHADPATSRR